MLLYDLRDPCIEKLFEKHAELEDANLLEGEDPEICKWLKKRYNVICKFNKKLQKAEDPEDYRQEVKDNLIDGAGRLIFGE